jgi:hypothetical protein
VSFWHRSWARVLRFCPAFVAGRIAHHARFSPQEGKQVVRADNPEIQVFRRYATEMTNLADTESLTSNPEIKIVRLYSAGYIAQ